MNVALLSASAGDAATVSVSSLLTSIGSVFTSAIAAPPQFVVDRPLTESQLPRDLPHRYLVPPHGFQLVPLRLCHVVSLSHLPYLLNKRCWSRSILPR